MKEKTEILNPKDFTANLPHDYMRLVSIAKESGEMISNSLPSGILFAESDPFNQQIFCIQNGQVYFSGSFSRWWVIRIIQKIWDRFFPKKYVMKYIPITPQWIQKINPEPTFHFGRGQSAENPIPE